MDLTHIHLLLNHFPTIGTIIGIGLFVVSLFAKGNDVKQASLAILLGIALITIPTYISGNAAQAKICGWDPTLYNPDDRVQSAGRAQPHHSSARGRGSARSRTHGNHRSASHGSDCGSYGATRGYRTGTRP